MSRWLSGTFACALGLTLALGMACGPKQESRGQTGVGGGGSAGAGGAAAQAGSGGLGMGGTVAAGASSSGGKAGGPTLPPDGEVPPAVALSKLDLLLMVDNSRNTDEKQRLLSEALTWLLTDAGAPTLSVDDIHVGVVTSSLGSHGASGPRDVCVAPDDNDRARLVATMRAGVPTFNDSGFLAWGPEAGDSATLQDLASGLTNMLATVGSTGCGYEASLEAWYRFLVDPEPPAEVVVPAGGSVAQLQGVDEVLLSQRAAFLRPDSVLAIVTLSDENDCSIVDEGYGWLISRAMPIFRSTSVCQTNPNDPCCQSCGEARANDGCPALDADPACLMGDFLTTTAGANEDSLNLRCFEQKRRFGFELLHPISRYTEALTRQHQFNRAKQPVKNPIFAGNMRHPSQVVYQGIVGVPWQDLADDASLAGPGLTYLTAAELTAKQRWAMMIGDPDASPPVRPSDPFMIEATYDRAMLSSVSGHPLVPTETLVASDSLDPQANAINGHESVDVNQDDLQYACTFPLAVPKTCDEQAFNGEESCRCFADDLPKNRALCQPPGGGQAAITQFYEAAYPGVRHLQLLQSLGDTGVTASACPKVVDTSSADYGYRPAMRALAARIEQRLAP